MKKHFTVFTVGLLLGITCILSPTYGQWVKYDIDTEMSYAALLHAADIDMDGDLDVAATGNDVVVWYENYGLTWNKHVIGENLRYANGVYVADIDGDGDLDMAATGIMADEVVWYENIGGTPISWTEHTIDGDLNGAVCIWVVDIDGDDTLDVVATGESADDVLWYENHHPTWTPHFIDGDLDGAQMFEVVDLDEDGDLDVVVAGKYADDVVWYENLGGSPIKWTKYTIDGNLNGAFDVGVADINGDDTLDVVATGSVADDVIWYENHHPIWTPHLIDADLDGAQCLSIADINFDNEMDVVVIGFDADSAVWYENHHPIWTPHLIDADLDGGWDIITADLDGDDRQDVIATSHNANKVVWYNNIKPGDAHPKSVQCHPRFIPTQGDTLIINAQLSNPESHPTTVQAIIRGAQQAITDSLPLYDDGQHGDSAATDNIWGNSKWIAGLPENTYMIGVSTHDITEDHTYYLPPIPRFTTIGPVEVVDFEITSSDTVPNPGDQIKVKLNLKNKGQKVTALNITTPKNLMSLDTSATIKTAILSKYGDIAPGETSAGNRSYTITFSDASEPDKNYFFVVDILSDEVHWWSDTFSVCLEPTAIKDVDQAIPVAFSLQQNYPNPFNPKTVISWQLAVSTDVELSVYNLMGQKVATLVSEKQNPGSHQVEWDATDFATGVYYYQLRTDAGFIQTKKLVLLR